MAVSAKLKDSEIKAVAEAVLGSEMADLGFAGVDLQYRDIYDDEPSLFIGAHVAGDVPAPFDAERFSRLLRLLHDALLAQGEERFPHLGLKRAGDEPPQADLIPDDA